ncbi:DUF2079 domain-containing protein [Chloroflexales bacterium ZM16-3]|nr:DUF2079 domain-containing protein [Chloroflexales bacterium ZM16-3]
MTHPRRSGPFDDPFFVAACLLVALMMIGLSLARYYGYNAGMLDLGVMSQAIWSGTQGKPLLQTAPDMGPRSRLAVHVELIYFALVPLYALWSSPQALLVAQGLLFVAGALPAYRLALRSTESILAARCMALIYLLYPVAQTAVLFDFHGDTLAMPLLLFALDAADRRDWRSFGLWSALALSCKMYIALPIAGIGAYLFLWGGQRRAGLITAAAGLIYGALAFLVVREIFKTPGLAGSAAGSYISHYFGAYREISSTALVRALNVAIIFGPALILARRGWRWLLVGSPLALAALLSTGPGGSYYYYYHHYAAVVPFIVMAVVDGAGRMRERSLSNDQRPTTNDQELAADKRSSFVVRRSSSQRTWRGDLIFTTLIVFISSALLVNTPLSPFFWQGSPGKGFDSTAYGSTSRDRVKDAFLAEYVTPQAAVAASMFLATHIANRETLYVVRYSDDSGGERLPRILPLVDMVVADALFDWRVVSGEKVLGKIDYEAAEIKELLGDPSFALRAERDGLLLFTRGDDGLRQEITALDAAELPPMSADFGPVQLLGAQVTAMGGRRYLAEFEWQLKGAPPTSRLVAISQFDGIPDARIVHLPSYVLLPTDQWQPGQVIRERFEIELPAEVAPGSYTWRTGWYDPAQSEAYATDQRSRLPGSVDVAITTIDVGQ